MPCLLVTRLTELAFTQVHAIDIVTCLLGVPCLFAKASGKDFFLYCKWHGSTQDGVTLLTKVRRLRRSCGDLAVLTV